MPTPLLPRPLPKAVWFVLLYLAGLASLTLLALLLKGLLNGL